MARKLEIEIVGDTAALSRSLGKAEKGVGRFGGKLSKVGKLAGIGGLAGGIGVAVVALKNSVGAAMEAEKAEARLGQAFDVVKASAKERQAAQEAVNRVSRQAALDDEDLSDSLAKLTRATGDVSKAQEGMALAANIARARNISLEAATKTVERGLLGSETAFKKVGVAVTKGMTATEAFAKAQRQFAGSAEAYGKTSAGAQEKFQVAVENLQESIGKHLLPILARLAAKASEAIVWLEQNWPRISQVVKETMEKIRPYIEPVYAWIKAATKLTVALIQGDWGEALDNLATMLKATFQNIENIIKGWYSLIWAATKALWKGMFDAAVDGLGDLPGWMTGKLDEVLAGVGRKFGDAYTKAKAFGAKLKDGAVAGVTGIGNAVWGVVNNIGEKLAGATETVVGWGKSVGIALKNAHVDGIKGLPGLIWEVINNLGPFLEEKLKIVVGWGAKIGGWIKDGAVAALKGIGGAIVAGVKAAINEVIDAFNRLGIPGFKINLPKPVPDVSVPGISLPDIPRLHSGGEFRASRPGGEGLALLRDRETVLPAGRFAGGVVHEHHYHGPVVQDSAFIAYLKGLEAKDRARNGRAAFGGSSA